MHDDLRRFIVASNRDKLDSLPGDWESRVAGFPGVRLVGKVPGRLQVEATQAAIDQVAATFGDTLRVEQAMQRRFP